MYGASIGYPPGLTRERFISFARNTINRGILQKHYSWGKRQKPVNTNFRLLSFTNKQNWNTVKFGKTLFTDLVNLLINNRQDYTPTLYNFLFSTETLFGRETKKERKYRFVSTRNDTSELVVFLSTCTPLFIGFWGGSQKTEIPLNICLFTRYVIEWIRMMTCHVDKIDDVSCG